MEQIEINSHSGDNKIDSFSRKQNYSTNTQAVVDGNLEFLNIAAGYLCNIHDPPRILRDSALYIQVKRNNLLTELTDVIDGYKVRPL